MQAPVDAGFLMRDTRGISTTGNSRTLGLPRQGEEETARQQTINALQRLTEGKGLEIRNV